MKLQTLRRTLAATLLVGTCPLALAQQSSPDTPDGRDERLSTVIVTGVGPQRSTDEMIGNATAVSRDDIVQTLQASLGNSLDNQPGGEPSGAARTWRGTCPGADQWHRRH